jgi:hypothetical protein
MHSTVVGCCVNADNLSCVCSVHCIAAGTSQLAPTRELYWFGGHMLLRLVENVDQMVNQRLSNT